MFLTLKKITNFKNRLGMNYFSDKIKSINPSKIGGHIGDMVNLENALSFKKFFKL